MKWTVILITIGLILIPGMYPLSKESGQPPEPQFIWKAIEAKVTHYCWKEKAERRWKGKTSLNSSAKNEDGVAVDPRIIPYGTVIYIPDIGIRVADDTGGACRRYGNQGKTLIDVRWADKTTPELRKIGAQNQTVYILTQTE